MGDEAIGPIVPWSKRGGSSGSTRPAFAKMRAVSAIRSPSGAGDATAWMEDVTIKVISRMAPTVLIERFIIGTPLGWMVNPFGSTWSFSDIKVSW